MILKPPMYMKLQKVFCTLKAEVFKINVNNLIFYRRVGRRGGKYG